MCRLGRLGVLRLLKFLEVGGEFMWGWMSLIRKDRDDGFGGDEVFR